jgi:hypothetical protein
LEFNLIHDDKNKKKKGKKSLGSEVIREKNKGLR